VINRPTSLAIDLGARTYEVTGPGLSGLLEYANSDSPIVYGESSKHLSGENFCRLADYSFTTGYPHLPKPSRMFTLDHGLVYSHTGHVHIAFSQLKQRQGPFVLISSQGDYCTDYDVRSLPNSVVRWFSVSARPSPRVEGIPYGLADSRYNTGCFDHGQWHLLEDEMTRTRPIRNLVHGRFAIDTNGDRSRVKDHFEGKSWCSLATYHFGQMGSLRGPRLSYRDYLEELHSFRFTISPFGGGYDCHRTWEALYLGVIPIVRRIPVLSWFEALPICWVDDWVDVTESFLDREYDRIKSTTWNMDMLWMDHWKRRIRAALPKL
jgi:hypothetical protein